MLPSTNRPGVSRPADVQDSQPDQPDHELGGALSVARGLEERGNDVLSAASGVEARALADSGKLEDTESVPTDFAMPGAGRIGLDGTSSPAKSGRRWCC